MLRKLVLFSRFVELKNFKQNLYFFSISWIKKCWQNWTYFQSFFGAFSGLENFEVKEGHHQVLQ